nr:syntaxin-132-like [Tanacetum cinerariifolium]
MCRPKEELKKFGKIMRPDGVAITTRKNRESFSMASDMIKADRERGEHKDIPINNLANIQKLGCGKGTGVYRSRTSATLQFIKEDIQRQDN